MIITGGGDDRVAQASFAKVCAGKGDDVVGLLYSSRVNLGRGDDRTILAKRSYGNDVVRGGPGGDRIKTGPGRDRIMGGRGDDILRGQHHADEIRGGSGEDHLFGGSGFDHLLGGPGDDLLRVGSGGPSRRIYFQKEKDLNLKLIRRGKLITTIQYGVRTSCGGSGRHTSSKLKVRIKDDNGQGKFDYRRSDNGDWYSYSERIHGRINDRFAVGRLRFIDSTDIPACWTGKSRKDQWIGFRAKVKPRERQIAKQ